MSVQAHRSDFFNTQNTEKIRQALTASQHKNPQNIFSPEQAQNLKLNNLRQKRKQLEDKLKLVSNKINYRKKRQQQQLRRFMRSEQKTLSLMETHNYKKFNNLIKEEFDHKKQFQLKKRSKEVEETRIHNQKRLNLINQAIRDRKRQQSQKLRYTKKIDEEMIKYSRDMALSVKKQRHETVNKMKERQNTKKRCYWLEKRISFQNKLQDEALIYQKQIEQYFNKIQHLKEQQTKLKQQQSQAQEVLKTAQQNLNLLKNS